MTSPLSRCVVIAIAASLFFQGAARVSAQVTPNSPKVRALADKAFKYLESPESRKAPQMMHIGGPILLGYAIFKYGKRYKKDMTKHARVLEALDKALKFAANRKESIDVFVARVSKVYKQYILYIFVHPKVQRCLRAIYKTRSSLEHF